MKNVTLSSQTHDRVHQEEIKKACHERIGSLQEAMVLSGHFGRDKMRAIVAARGCFACICK